MEYKNNDDNKQKRITISDIANDLGLSKTTISRVISGKGRIGNETKARVMKYIEEHDYTPNLIAKGLAQSKTYNICITVPIDYKLTDLPFFQSCLMGVCEIASSLDYDVLVTIVADNDISQLTRIITNHKVDGVIITRTLVKDISEKYLKEKGVPFVVIGSSLDNDIIQVDNNHREACKELTSILIMKGFKRIALIGGNTTHIVTRNRYNGYVDGLNEHNLQVNQELVYMDANNGAIVEKIVDELLVKKIDCIICMDDLICNYVLNKFEKDKIKIPTDIKIASFYNSALLDSYKPSITSLKFNVRELAMTTCKVLIDLIEGKNVLKKTLLDYEIGLKESTK